MRLHTDTKGAIGCLVNNEDFKAAFSAAFFIGVICREILRDNCVEFYIIYELNEECL
jgi:hypothetical protein